MRWSIVTLLLLACAGEDPECTPNETECDGDKVIVCDGEGFWMESADCEEGLMCMEMDDGLQHCMDAMGDDDDM